MKNKLHVHYDEKGDYLEIRIGEPRPSYYEDLGNDTFLRKDEKTNKVMGVAFWNFKKKPEKQYKDFEIEIPAI